MSKNVSNEQYNTALGNRDNQRIMLSVCSAFKQSIDPDKLHEIRLISLWEALKTWNPTGRKFSAYLFQQTRWNCIKTINEQKRVKTYNIQVDKTTQQPSYFNELVEYLPEELREIFVKRFVCGMTLREIAKEYGFCCETGRRRLIKGFAILKENHIFD